MEEQRGLGAFASLDLARLRQVLEVLPICVTVYDANGRVVLANQARQAWFGAESDTLDDAISRSTPRREDGTAFARDELPGPRALRGETVTGERMRIRVQDGREIAVLANSSPLRDDSGALIGAVLVLSDVTALSDLDRGRRELFSMANHDLRAPIGAVLAFVEAARRHTGDPVRMGETLDKIERAAQRMLRLTTDLLDAARFETGRVPISPRTADLAARVRASIARQPDPALFALTPPAGPVTATFDEDRIDQVLDNLLANAAKHTADGTRVDVRLDASDREILVYVRDRGAGISPDERAKLFAPFYQTPRGRSYGGTGLGLHISRRIAEAHGGRLVLEESSPHGSTFTLALPISSAR